ncbi:MAG: HAMP domain-containing histidine kinase [Bacteroidetes bacterium]|nr:HAMP domain-containing histidine kinase [Bacteroidota bacterium]MBU1115172.1 HAMP domain-containing histidine kinase [Bacteroidota bacterium]MBU1799343.1 HAMP domain-containing histidine kinase [Bacteroidota bacterium]
MLPGEVQNNKLQLIGKLTASLIHEIRNPLSVIKLNLDLIKLEDNLSKDILDSVNDSLSATNRIEYMIDNLLSFARVVTHGHEHFSLNKITSNAIDLLAVKANKYGINIVTEFDESLSQIYADKNKLLQILLNLITNAIESYNKDCKGDIIIKTSSSEENGNKKIHWSVKDSGVGISEDNISKIFEDFYTSKVNGTGLGLSVCKMLADELEVQIEFESKPGHGTIFKVTFDVNRMRKLYEATNTSN